MYSHSVYYENQEEARTMRQWIERRVQPVELELLPPDEAGLSEIQFVTESPLPDSVIRYLAANKSTGQYAFDIEG